MTSAIYLAMRRAHAFLAFPTMNANSPSDENVCAHACYTFPIVALILPSSSGSQSFPGWRPLGFQVDS